MDWITDDLLIGNYLDVQDVGAIVQAGIHSIVSLDGSLRDSDYSGHDVHEIACVDLIDGPGNSPAIYIRAVDALQRLRKHQSPVLVHCHAGRSRSAVVVASHFMRDHGLSLSDAMELISSKREVIITAGLQEVLDFHKTN